MLLMITQDASIATFCISFMACSCLQLPESLGMQSARHGSHDGALKLGRLLRTEEASLCPVAASVLFPLKGAKIQDAFECSVQNRRQILSKADRPKESFEISGDGSRKNITATGLI